MLVFGGPVSTAQPKCIQQHLPREIRADEPQQLQVVQPISLGTVFLDFKYFGKVADEGQSVDRGLTEVGEGLEEHMLPLQMLGGVLLDESVGVGLDLNRLQGTLRRRRRVTSPSMKKSSELRLYSWGESASWGGCLGPT